MTEAQSLNRFLEVLCLWREARGESNAAKAAVLAVIRNRAVDPQNRWPKDIGLVVTQPFQFSSFNQHDPNVTAWPNPKKTADWNAWLDCCAVVDTPLLADPTEGAQFYHDISIPPPYRQWMGSAFTEFDLLKRKTAEIGRLRFYKL